MSGLTPEELTKIIADGCDVFIRYIGEALWSPVQDVKADAILPAFGRIMRTLITRGSKIDIERVMTAYQEWIDDTARRVMDQARVDYERERVQRENRQNETPIGAHVRAWGQHVGLGWITGQIREAMVVLTRWVNIHMRESLAGIMDESEMWALRLWPPRVSEDGSIIVR